MGHAVERQAGANHQFVAGDHREHVISEMRRWCENGGLVIEQDCG